jgi:hypothetical protein
MQMNVLREHRLSLTPFDHSRGAAGEITRLFYAFAAVGDDIVLKGGGGFGSSEREAIGS